MKAQKPFHLFSQSPDQKLLVHCLDGVEKTGLFLCAFLLYQKMALAEKVDLAWSVLTARDANPLFLSGPEQFKFLVKLEKQGNVHYSTTKKQPQTPRKAKQ